MFGQHMDKQNLAGLSVEVDSLTNRISSMQLLFLMEQNSSAFCPVYKSELNTLDVQMQNVGYKLDFLEREKKAFDATLKKQYFILEAESYLLSKKVKQVCKDNNTLLVYFYSNTNCSICRNQGDEILKARDSLLNKKTVKIYSFDGDIGSPVAKALMLQYNVSSYPSIVIDGITYSGYRDSNNITGLITGG